LITIKPTPNRGDCLGLAGIAREVSAITGASLTTPEAKPVSPVFGDEVPIRLAAPEACPRYCGRLVRGVNVGAVAPRWMVERLQRSGLRSVSAVVDITNYVMLEQDSRCMPSMRRGWRAASPCALPVREKSSCCSTASSPLSAPMSS
jgi:phenylalanyl-tRNA synthetase beta chain